MTEDPKTRDTEEQQENGQQPAGAGELDDQALEQVAGGVGGPLEQAPKDIKRSLREISAGTKVVGQCAIKERQV